MYIFMYQLPKGQNVAAERKEQAARARNAVA